MSRQFTNRAGADARPAGRGNAAVARAPPAPAALSASRTTMEPGRIAGQGLALGRAGSSPLVAQAMRSAVLVGLREAGVGRADPDPAAAPEDEVLARWLALNLERAGG
jgi:hypothetical protein